MTNSAPNRIFDEFAKVFTDTAGAAQGVRREVETIVRTQVERLLNQLEIVQREEFEAARDMAVRARTENEELKRRIAALEARLGADAAPAVPGEEPPSPAAPTL